MKQEGEKVMKSNAKEVLNKEALLKFEHHITFFMVIFMVTPCINDINPFLVQLMHL